MDLLCFVFWGCGLGFFVWKDLQKGRALEGKPVTCVSVRRLALACFACYRATSSWGKSSSKEMLFREV